MKTIDLHTHTSASDGTLTPEALLELALEKKLSAIAITDHDTIDGVVVARGYLSKHSERFKDFELISGIEFSTSHDIAAQDIHILGLYINEFNRDFTEALTDLINSREVRNHQMIDKLNQLGYHISYEDVLAESSDGVITRAHFAGALIKKGYIQTTAEAFTKLIGNNCPAYVSREKVTPSDAIQLILKCGGVPVLAHPTLYNLPLDRLELLIGQLKEEGLQGIEAIYSLHTKKETAYLTAFADQYDLIITGGSDFHGRNKVSIDLGSGRGDLAVPESLLEPLKACRK